VATAAVPVPSGGLKPATVEVLAELKRVSHRPDWPGCDAHSRNFLDGCGMCATLARHWGKPATRVELIAALRDVERALRGAAMGR
jgi:hypothetical protein